VRGGVPSACVPAWGKREELLPGLGCPRRLLGEEKAFLFSAGKKYELDASKICKLKVCQSLVPLTGQVVILLVFLFFWGENGCKAVFRVE